MKTNLFFISQDYETTRLISKKVAEFFSMRLFDSIEMFEFDNSPRTLEEITAEFGRDYTKKEMRSIAKMQLDFGDAVFVGDFRFLDAYNEIGEKINSKNLVIFLNNKSENSENPSDTKQKLIFLASWCDLAINISCLPNEEIFDKVILEIKNFYGLEG